MSKAKRLLILLGCCVALCISAWAVNRHYAPKQDIVLMEKGPLIFALEGTKTLSWTWEEQTISFDLTQEEWKLTGDPDYRLSRLSQSDILKSIETIHARRIIDDPGNLAQYGLDHPACTITADTTVISIGDNTAVGGLCYLSIGDGKVYLVSDTIIYPFTRTLEQMSA